MRLLHVVLSAPLKGLSAAIIIFKNGGKKKKMITKSLLLLALLAGSATAFAPNASKNVITVDKDVSELKMHAMGEEAFMEKIDERTVYNKHDSIVFSYAGIKTNSFVANKAGCQVALKVDKENETVTATVDFIEKEGNFELVADNHEKISVFFIKDGDKYVTSVASKEQAIYNAETITGIDGIPSNTSRGVVELRRDDDLVEADLGKLDLLHDKINKDLLERIDRDVMIRALTGVSGTFVYTDDYGVTMPLRGVKVEVHSVLDGEDVVVKTGYTSQTGTFSYLTARIRPILIRDDIIEVREIAPTFYFKLYSEGTSIKVVDENSNEYTWQSGTRIPSTIRKRTSVTYTFTMDDAVGKGFAITQPAIMASNFANYVNNGEDITMCTIKYPGATSGCYYSGNFINIAPRDNSNVLNSRPNPYEDYDVMGHEYGHHVQRVFGITHNPGGTHYSRHNAEDDFHDQMNSSGTNMYTEAQARRRGLDLAYAEGWATAYSLIAQHHFADVYQDAHFFGDARYTAANGVNVGYGNYEVCKGEGAEESVTAFIWNVFDDYDEADPNDTLCYPDDLLMTMSHNAYTFSEFLMNFEDGDPDEVAVGKLLARLNMCPNSVAPVGNMYTNVSPTFRWNCSGGSRYYTINEFYFSVFASGQENTEHFGATVRVDGTPTTASVRIPLTDWTRLLATGATELEVQVTGYVDRCNIRTGGYRTEYFYFDVPTEEKDAPDPVTMTPGEWGFPQKYDGTVLTTSFVRNDVNFSTSRLRTGLIERDQVVLSAKKKNAGHAYFEITTDVAMENVEYNISLWSASEGIRPNNSTITVEVLDENGDWVMDADLWNDVTLPTDRNNMLLLSTNNIGMIYGIRFDVTGPASGSSNQGRVALRNITFNF